MFPQIKVAIFDKQHKAGDDNGPYRREDTPIRFAIKNGLLSVHARDWQGQLLEECKQLKFGEKNSETDSYVFVIDHLEKGISLVHERCQFNTEVAYDVFLGQLGQKWTSLEDLSHAHTLLFCALGLYAGGEKDRSYELFRELNNKWNPNKKRKHIQFDQRRIIRLKKEILGFEEVKDAIANHAYVLTVFQGLLFNARKKGRVPSNIFYWLKKEDRTLWYALNQEGGQCGWTESGAARAHVLAERAIKQELGDTATGAIYVPVINECVKALYNTLYREGWIAEIYPNRIT